MTDHLKGAITSSTCSHFRRSLYTGRQVQTEVYKRQNGGPQYKETVRNRCLAKESQEFVADRTLILDNSAFKEK